uniref:phospholipase D n=1 Tax=Globisporangium ultimum (strain ATCC 200006 / CBS 805.95 / DAOM BR144) TaxID=431595 RepID=K3WNR3_GLOUD
MVNVRSVALVLLATAAPLRQVLAKREAINCRFLENPMKMTLNLCICQPCHMCEFHFSHFGCGLIDYPELDESDGSDVTIEQPILDLDKWFLTRDEITAARGGFPRNDLQVYSTGNHITTFSATNEYFHSVYVDLSTTGVDDRIFLTGWSVADVPFEPQIDPTGSYSGFETIFASAVERGANFNALVWNNVLESQQNVQVRDFINGLPPSPNGGKALFIFDDRLSSSASAHHQKSVVIHRKDTQLVAYLGGVDLTYDRWDTSKHNNIALRKRAGIQKGNNGWCDAHLRIEGPAARDVAANFLGRWNSKTLPSQDRMDYIMDFDNPPYDPLPPLPPTPADIDSENQGQHNVQIVRTFSCLYKNYEFAPNGEVTLFHARIKAIRNAKNFIYIEDQYFVLVPELLDELLAVLPQLQRIIVVVPRPETQAALAGYEKYMFDNVVPIQKRYPNKFQFYATKESRAIYVHTKLVIIDDVYLSIGSGNWNRRSMTSDSEIGANIVDDEVTVNGDGLLVTKLALDFRLRKFSEHTGVSYNDLKKMKFIDAANKFDDSAVDPLTTIEHLELIEKPYFATYASDVVRQQIDSQDVCFPPAGVMAARSTPQTQTTTA